MASLRMLAVLLVVALATACTPPSKSTTEESAGTAVNGGATSSGVAGGGPGQGSTLNNAAGGPLGGPNASQENRVIYFDFDRYDVKPEYTAVLKAHSQYLVANPTAHVRLEGHTDERGSREYNIGLGERRAQAVRNIMLLQGVASSQISTVSYGEERPAVIGSDEEAWALNRRVEIVYGP